MHYPRSHAHRMAMRKSRPRLTHNPNGGSFCAYAYPAPYPEGTRNMRRGDFLTVVTKCTPHEVHTLKCTQNISTAHTRKDRSPRYQRKLTRCVACEALRAQPHCVMLW